MKTLLIYLLGVMCLMNIMAKTNHPVEDDCDVCSTSSSSTAINFDLNNQNYIGFYGLYQNYKTYNGIFNNSKQFNEHYRTLQISGNYMVNSKWNISVAMPMHFYSRTLEDNTIKQDESGIGDISISSMYLALQSDSINQSNWLLKLGGGIKAPTAEFKSRDGQGSNPNFNLGSGAWDFSVSSLFNLKFKKSGLNTQVTYTFKTENNADFQFGNQSDLSILYYRTVDWFKNKPLNVFGGVKSEFYESNKQYGYYLDHSKGYIHHIQFGGNVLFNKIQVGCLAFIPFKQNLMNNRIDAQFKGLIYANWNF